MVLEIDKLVFDPPELGTVLSLTGLPGASSKIYDRSPYGNVGTITGATWKKLPTGLWYLDFARSDHRVEISSNVTKGITALTNMVWVNPTDVSAPLTVMGDFTSATDMSILMGVTDVSGTSTWKMNAGIKGESGSRQTLNGDTTTLAYGTWYFIAHTWDGTNRYIYVNGVQDGTVANVDTQLETTVTLNTIIGAYAPASGKENMNGGIALPRILNTGFSVAQILSIFNQEKHLFGVW